MSTTYKVTSGDTFATVSRRVYGDERFADLIRRSNPGINEPLVTGTTLTVLTQPEIVSFKPSVLGVSNPDEVSVLIGGTRLTFWQSFTLVRSMDTVDTFSLSSPFDADQPEYRELFRPLSFKEIDISIGSEQIFKGTLIDVDPSVDEVQQTVSISAYSTPGVLNDCTVSANDYPIEFDFSDLRVIAESLLAPFGLVAQFDDDPGAMFERVQLEPTQQVLTFLIDLAQQRGLLVSSTESGKLLFHKENSTQPVARLKQGQSPLLSVQPSFDPQSYFSHITGIEWVIVGLTGNQYTVKNPLLTGAIRPLSFSVPDTQGGDVQTAVEAKAGRMIANAVSYNLPVATWRDSNGDLWKPNTTITLQAKGAMVYSEYSFLIRTVTFSATPESRTAILEVVLPGSFSAKIPESLPWQD